VAQPGRGHRYARDYKRMSKALDDLDEEQRAAAVSVEGPVCIVAGAGTGKTRTVTHRLAHGIAIGKVDPRRTLAVTHSRQAAAELGERLGRLGAEAVDARTFHSAGLWVARSFWALAASPRLTCSPPVRSGFRGERACARRSNGTRQRYQSEAVPAANREPSDLHGFALTNKGFPGSA
jgi:superfamily I DNA/RNA helicase